MIGQDAVHERVKGELLSTSLNQVFHPEPVSNICRQDIKPLPDLETIILGVLFRHRLLVLTKSQGKS